MANGLLDFMGFQQGGYDPRNQYTATAQNATQGMNLPNLFMTQPGLANAFMTPEQQQQLQNQATKRGLLTGALTYLATPKNLGLGSAVPYLSKAYLGGMQGAQSTYDTQSRNLKDMLTLQKLGRQIELQGMTAGEKAQAYVDKARLELSKDPENAALKQKVLDAENQLKKQTTFAPPTIVFKEQGAEAQEVGKYFGKTFTDLQEAEIKSRQRVQKLERASNLLKDIDTGKLTAQGVELGKLLNSAGFPIAEDIGNIEAADALFKEYALELRNPAGGAGMPGAMSDADREFLAKASGGITTSPKAREIMLETQQALAKRNSDVAKLAREYRKTNGQIDEGFYDKLAEFSEKNNLFPKTFEEKYGAGQSMSSNMIGGDIQPKTSGGFRLLPTE